MFAILFDSTILDPDSDNPGSNRGPHGLLGCMILTNATPYREFKVDASKSENEGSIKSGV